MEFLWQLFQFDVSVILWKNPKKQGKYSLDYSLPIKEQN